MTKYVHIINADNSQYKVKILIQDQVYDHFTREFTNEWKTVEEVDCNNPGQLVTRYLTSSRRILIEENGNL